MDKVFKKKLLILVLLLSWTLSKSQDFLGLHSSNYAGAIGAISNPANIADSRMKFDIYLGGVNTSFENNYVGVKNSAFDWGSIIRLKTDAMPISNTSNNKDSSDYYQNYLVNYPLKGNMAFYANQRVVLPSFMVNLGKKSALALNVGARNYFNLDGISAELAEAAYDEFKDSSKWLTLLSNPDMSYSHMTWIEYGLTYARVIQDDGRHFFKAGITPKLLQGLASSYCTVKNLELIIDTQNVYSFISSDVAYGYSDNVDFSDPNSVKVNFKPSYGFGIDVGGVYEWRPDYQEYKYNMDGETDLWRRDQNKYKLKASLAVNDIGSIRFKNGEYSNAFNAKIDNWDLAKEEFSGVRGFDSVMSAKFPPNKSTSDYKIFLPSTINAQVDYNIAKCYYLNLTANLANAKNYKEFRLHEFTNLSLAPSIDLAWFGVSIPVSYNSLSAQHGDPVKVGTMLRLGPLIVGTNDILSYLTKEAVYGVNAYLLLKLPIPYFKTRDLDNDNISDRKDKCKEVPGIWEFNGCPDKDGDHIQDSEDLCPDVPGLKELQGCPDKDGDGITDSKDACPDSAGTIEFNGCPDRDGDKIIDRLDACPDEAGLSEFFGCPDKDLDGTMDKEDACPDIFGPKEFKGCPDKDGDGIMDMDDACPEQAGPLENKGCPWPDTDGDGVLDKDDSCKTIVGVPQFLGCPPPPPPMKAAERKILEKAFASLEFATAKDIIKPKSFPSLNALAKLMIDHEADWTLKLAGHTDNEGDPEKNMVLSEKRANAVKNYLVKKGANARNIKAEWFGSTQPIADNKTAKGRQKNRRVEMKIMMLE